MMNILTTPMAMTIFQNQSQKSTFSKKKTMRIMRRTKTRSLKLLMLKMRKRRMNLSMRSQENVGEFLAKCLSKIVMMAQTMSSSSQESGKRIKCPPNAHCARGRTAPSLVRRNTCRQEERFNQFIPSSKSGSFELFIRSQQDLGPDTAPGQGRAKV